MFRTLPILTLLLLTACQSTPERASVKPGINDPYLNPNLQVEEWTERFEVESREIYSSRQAIVKALQVEPGMDIADIGAGTGLFTRPLALATGASGKVYAVDIVPKFIEHIRNRADEAGLSWVETVLCKEDSVELPEDSVDLALICDVYHHFEYPHDSMTSLRKAMRSGSNLIVIDFHRIPGKSREWLLNHVRAGQEVFRAEIEAAGFTYVEDLQIPGLTDNYAMRFTVSK